MNFAARPGPDFSSNQTMIESDKNQTMIESDKNQTMIESDNE
jgi:hypothetical protein